MLSILELVNRNTDHLVMNQSENARRYNETKQLIDRTLPLVNHGKGRMLRFYVRSYFSNFYYFKRKI